MSRSRARTPRWAPCLIFVVVNSANHRSTPLSDEPEVGAKCRWKRGWRRSQRRIPCLVGRVVVQDQVHAEVGADLLVVWRPADVVQVALRHAGVADQLGQADLVQPPQVLQLGAGWHRGGPGPPAGVGRHQLRDLRRPLAMAEDLATMRAGQRSSPPQPAARRSQVVGWRSRPAARRLPRRRTHGSAGAGGLAALGRADTHLQAQLLTDRWRSDLAGPHQPSVIVGQTSRSEPILAGRAA